MGLLSVRKVSTVVVVFSLAIACCNAQTSSRGRKAEKALFGRSINSRQKKVKEPRAVVKAKKKQERNEAKLKKEYAKFVKDSRKRAFEIQSSEVQERMNQNKKTIKVRDKIKKKKVKSATKKAGKKYG